MNHDDLHYMGMREIGLAIQAGELSSEAVTERHSNASPSLTAGSRATHCS